MKLLTVMELRSQFKPILPFYIPGKYLKASDFQVSSLHRKGTVTWIFGTLTKFSEVVTRGVLKIIRGTPVSKSLF